MSAGTAPSGNFPVFRAALTTEGGRPRIVPRAKSWLTMDRIIAYPRRTAKVLSTCAGVLLGGLAVR